MRLVLLPGLDGTGLLFARLVEALGGRVATTIVDYPADRALNYAEHEKIARSFLPSDEPYVLVGESFSGPIAISIAASRPPRLAGLILCCTFARNPVPSYSRLRSLISLIPFSYLPKAAQSPFIFGRFSTRSLRSEHRNAVSKVSNAALRARINAIFDIDVTSELEQIDLPTLLIQASEDHVVPTAASQQVEIPNAQRVVLEGPHLLLQAAADKSSEIIVDFVRCIASR